MRVVPALEPREDRHPRLGVTLERPAIDDFTLEGGEEALGHGVVVRIASRSHRGHDASFATSLAERIARILAALVGMVNDRLRPPLRERHVERIEHELGL